MFSSCCAAVVVVVVDVVVVEVGLKYIFLPKKG
jgi:hypothetical protein